MPHAPLDARHLAFNRAAMIVTHVELRRAAHSRAIGGDSFNAAAHHLENGRKVPFDERAHRVDLVVQPARIDDLDTAGDIIADALPLTKRRNAEFEQDHELIVNEVRGMKKKEIITVFFAA